MVLPLILVGFAKSGIPQDVIEVVIKKSINNLRILSTALSLIEFENFFFINSSYIA